MGRKGIPRRIVYFSLQTQLVKNSPLPIHGQWPSSIIKGPYWNFIETLVRNKTSSFISTVHHIHRLLVLHASKTKNAPNRLLYISINLTHAHIFLYTHLRNFIDLTIKLLSFKGASRIYWKAITIISKLLHGGIF